MGQPIALGSIALGLRTESPTRYNRAIDSDVKLFGISDLHLHYKSNRQALEALPAYPLDWLVVAGDIGETEAQFEFAFKILTRRFQQVLWAPGNHDLWTLPSQSLRGLAKYERLIALCRSYGVYTPEDPYIRWPGMPTN